MKDQLIQPVFHRLILASLPLFVMAGADAATVTSGDDPAASLKGAARYRHMNSNGMQKEIYLGVPPLDTAANRNTGDVSWGTGKHVVLTYDASANNLTTVVGTGTSAVTVTRNVGSLGALNYLLLNVQQNGMMGGGMGSGMMNGSISFNNAKLNGVSLPVGAFPGAASGAKWSITGEDLTRGFSLEGDIVLTGMQPGMDMNHVEISVGYTDQTGPQITGIGVQPNPAILNGVATLRATVDDSLSGNNRIQSAEYSLNGGAWMAMGAQDGVFDSVWEGVDAELSASKLGVNEICVRGTDAKGNVTAPPRCTTFLVTYQFEGFYEPINGGTVNAAKAGQTLPGKWRLSDANGVPVEEISSFAGFYSYAVDCETFSGSTSDAVEEYAAGNSGLQYGGDGYWQYNWKTPKSYAGTCRAMYVAFDSGAASPIVTFKFK
ncbi:PxKF domain-containing protein [Methylococcus sp. ANG]|uniref:PxKF domain-containing protein n=2 Tax=unclassified Methylococcus TaxID=2618889 RepID=UPI003458A4AE